MYDKRGKVWSEEDKQFLTNNWESMTDDELANALKRTPASIELMRHRLKLTKPPKHVTDEEIQFIKDNVGKLKYVEMAKQLNRPLPTIYSVAKKLFPKKNDSNEVLWGRYTANDLKFLEVNMKSMSIFEIAETLNKSPKSVVNKLLREGLLDDK